MKILIIDYLQLHTNAGNILAMGWEGETSEAKAGRLLRYSLQIKPASFYKIQFIILDFAQTDNPPLARSVYVQVVRILETLGIYYTTTE